MYEGYRKIKKLSTEFRLGIENVNRVSETLRGYPSYIFDTLQTCPIPSRHFRYPLAIFDTLSKLSA